jgi:hypothetical protein
MIEKPTSYSPQRGSGLTGSLAETNNEHADVRIGVEPFWPHPRRERRRLCYGNQDRIGRLDRRERCSRAGAALAPG